MRRLPISIISATLMTGLLCKSACAVQSGEVQHISAGKQTSNHSLHRVYGRILGVSGTQMTIESRTHQVIKVDVAEALRAHMCAPLVVGHAIGVEGTSDARNVLHAQMISRAKDSLELWPADR